VNQTTGKVNVIVILKNLEETARLCQRRKLNGYYLVFDLHHENHNAIFFLEKEGKIVINYDPNFLQRSRSLFLEVVCALTPYRSDHEDFQRVFELDRHDPHYGQ
jgi:ADP-heptose:LPS heptosyltransferase